MSASEALQEVLAVMRADFRLVADRRVARGEWRQSDVNDYNAAIKATVAGKTEMDDGICVWWVWLKNQAFEERLMIELGAGSNNRIRASIAAVKQSKKAA